MATCNIETFLLRTLSFNDVQCACKYKQSSSSSETDVESKKPEWRNEYNVDKNYMPSYNICPSDINLAMVSNSFFEFDDFEPDNGRVLVPMMWGMIPFWHKGDYRYHGMTTNNCRLENMMESKLYKRSFMNGQRCVILCEGYYEWQTTKSVKSSEREAYFVYMTQKEGIKIYDKTTWSSDNVNLLKLAGLFDIWNYEGQSTFSFSVITMASNNSMSWLTHRMPAVLETEDQINNWLNYKTVTNKQAIESLKPAENLKFYRVSNLVNNSRNKSDQCNKPLDEIKKEKGNCLPKSKLMQSWLIGGKRKAELTNEDSKCIFEDKTKVKKIKCEIIEENELKKEE